MPSAQFKSTVPLTSTKVDRENGIIRDVALMSVGIACGSINGKPLKTEVTIDSLKALYALLSDGPKKSHMLHGDDHSPTNAIGIFSGFYLDMDSVPVTLRAAQFEAFKAFRENSKEEYETMFELAEKSPKDMALSADFDLNLEKRSGDLPPIVMPISIRSFDFVNEGAATPGLFSENGVDLQNEQEQQRLKDIETKSQLGKKQISTMKAVFAHFKDNPKALTHIAKFAEAADEKTTDTDIISKVELALSEDEQAAIIKERDDLLSEVSRLKGEVEALKPKADNEVALSSKVKTLEAEVAKFNQSRGRFGAAAVNLGQENVEAKSLTRAEFDKLSHPERNAHMAAGGKLTE